MFVENVVIGNTVESMFYALTKGYYHLTTPRYPLLFYRNLDVSILGHSTEPGAWTRLSMTLGLCGKLLNFRNVENVRIINNILKVNHSLGISEYEFKNCEIFDTTSVIHENETLKVSSPTFFVLDDFELKNLGRSVKKVEDRKTPDSFMRRIHFYTSERVDGAQFVTDCVSESILTQSQIHSFDFSDSIARFIVERHLESVGIFGLSAGKYKNGKVKYRKPKVKHVKRYISKIDNNIYKQTKSVKFVRSSLRETINV